MTRQTLIQSMGPVIDLIGEPVKVAGWYGSTNGLHTVSIKALNFKGSVVLEGTLSANPLETDWFTINLDNQSKLSFPRLVTLPTHGPGWLGESITLGYNVVVNCLFMRAKIIRSDIIPMGTTEQQISFYGFIDTIFVNY